MMPFRRLGQALRDPASTMCREFQGRAKILTRPAALALVAICWVALRLTQPTAANAQTLPPPIGPETPRVEATRGDDDIWHQKWFLLSLLDLRDDYAEAEAKGKRFAIVFEQRGCVYCTRMHTEVLAQKYINDYVRENFHVLQLDLWGSREVTDFDGTRMPEKKLAERWGVMFTPTVVFLKDGLTDIKTYGPPIEVTRMSLGFGAATFYDLFVWVRAKVYEADRNFQRFHLARHTEREALAKK